MGVYYGGPLGLTLRFCGVAQVARLCHLTGLTVARWRQRQTDFNATVLSPLVFGSWLTLLGK